MANDAETWLCGQSRIAEFVKIVCQIGASLAISLKSACQRKSGRQADAAVRDKSYTIHFFSIPRNTRATFSNVILTFTVLQQRKYRFAHHRLVREIAADPCVVRLLER
ncbi:hypothetical protein [Halococcus thailandensis]|uniref:hypothetical protein n=1 Tax=Halococcus thailandensis TaxID=335952 RepID=UPI001268BBF3|nr:hypothetical protein [Halococcus thailandensis]